MASPESVNPSMSLTMHTSCSVSVMGTPIAAPAIIDVHQNCGVLLQFQQGIPGETCLKLAAAGDPSAFFNSFTKGHALSESSRLI